MKMVENNRGMMDTVICPRRFSCTAEDKCGHSTPHKAESFCKLSDSHCPLPCVPLNLYEEKIWKFALVDLIA